MKHPRESLARDGYAVVSGLVPDGLLSAARDRICSTVNADLDTSETWYAHAPLDWSIVPIHHPQEFWDIRQWPAVHALFAELCGSEKLWVTMDRAVFKVPLSDAHRDHVDESVMHWDLDPRAPTSRTYQGMLFLTDTAAPMHPEGSDAERRERVECWRQKRAPVWWRGWKGHIDPEPGKPAELTPLGRRLVGVDPWP